MKRKTFVRLTLCIALVLAVSSVCIGQIYTPQPFSADFAATTHNGQKMMGKWYFSAPKMRIDMTSMPQSGQGRNPFGDNMAMIFDGSTGTSYMLMPQMQMYMEMRGNSERMSPGMANLKQLTTLGATCPQGATCKNLGTEVVNGRTCDKMEMTDKNRKSTVWIDQKLHFPIRVQDTDGVTTDFTNIKEGAQDASIFKVPAQYRPFDPSVLGRQQH